MDPQGFESSYRFEYADDATYGESGFDHAIVAPEGKLPATVEGKAAFTSGSATLSNLTTSAGAFAAGQAITGTGIPAATTILAIDGIHRTLTLSKAVTSGNGSLRAIKATGPQPVSQRFTGLAPGATYHWRIVATNEVGEAEGAPTLGEERHFRTDAEQEAPAADSCPNAALRGGASAGLPDCRAYEMVSPVDKAGSDIRSFTTLGGTPVAIDQADLTGDKLTYSSARRFGDAVSQPYVVQYLASRGTEGWSTHGISPPRGAYLGSFELADNEFRAFSPDLCKAWLVNDETSGPVQAPGATEREKNLYERTNCGSGSDGYRLLMAGEEGVVQGIASDGATLVRSGVGKLSLFGASGGGTPVCLLPDGTEPLGCSAGMAGSEREYESSVTNALSQDGRYAYWSGVSDGPGPIYLRTNPAQGQSALEHGAGRGKGDITAGSATVANVIGESGEFEVGQSIAAASFPRGAIPYGTTVQAVGAGTLTLSAPASQSATGIKLSAWSGCTEAARACTVPVSESVSPGEFSPEQTTQRATFLRGAGDGSRALFSFDPDHTETAPGPKGDDLYRYDAGSGASTLLAHDFLGILGASRDLSRVYLVSTDRIEGQGSEGQPNLYLHEDGKPLRFIATLAAADAKPQAGVFVPSAISEIPIGHTARVSEDGGSAAFVSYAPLSGYDNTDQGNGLPDSEVFLYRAGTQELLCVSCNPSGARPVGRELLDVGKSIGLSTAARLVVAEHALLYPRALSANGGRLFFESYEALVPADVNGARDVYEWEAPGEGSCETGSPVYSPGAGGCVSLLSSGKNGKDSSFLEASPDGSDVFFSTEASLLPQDPGLVDIYDARVNGGFAPPAPPPGPCEGEACQSPPAAPEDPVIGSLGFQGPGDLAHKKHKRRHCPKGRRRVRRHGRARCVKRRRHRAHRHHRRAHRNGRARR